MLSVLAAFALVGAQGPIARALYLPNPGFERPRLLLHIPTERMEVPKFAPKHPEWQFDWITSVLGDAEGEPFQYELRFRVFAQERRKANDKGESVGRLLGRLWEYNNSRLRFDHAPVYNNRVVDVYICYGGEPGGEQLFDEDAGADGRPVKVNTIYIYALDSFTEPVEMAREVCHEYGHATLPPIGGFSEPEDWANGFLGEKLYMRMLRDKMAAKLLEPVDAMGAPFEALDAWVKRHVDPLVQAAALKGPDAELLAGKGPAAMDAYLGLAAYAEAVLPMSVFRRGLVLTGSTKAADFPKALVLASEEPERYDLTIPDELKGKTLWIPSGKAAITGAKVLQQKGDWVKIQPEPGKKVGVVNGA